MKHSTLLLLALFLSFSLICQFDMAHAAITWTGDLDPADPNTWTDSTYGIIGNTADGSLTVDEDDDLYSSESVVGYNSGVTGQVTVHGVGSTWTTNRSLYVGGYGSGSLAITDGGSVSVNGWSATIGYGSNSTGEVTVSGTGSRWTDIRRLSVGLDGSGALTISNGGTVTATDAGEARTFIAYGPSSTGTVAFGPGGGTLTTDILYASPAQFTGTGTVNTHGLYSDLDLIFDTVASLTQTLHFDSEPGQDVTLNFDISDPSYVIILGAGYKGSGSLVIQDGLTVQSAGGGLGWHSGSTGVATVSGTGSAWINTSEVHVGRGGSGTLTITDGGFVSNGVGIIGYQPGSTGEVTVSGAGSTWTGSIDVGKSGDGVLTISDGGTVIADGTIGELSGSTGKVTVTGSGSTWTNNRRCTIGFRGSGTLTITDGGTVSNVDSSIGRNSGSTGGVTVSGNGSTWINSSYLSVGNSGNGMLAITAAGFVSNGNGYIGRNSGSMGEVTVSGNGSTWTNGDALTVGDSGIGALAITGGGAVTAMDVSIGSDSLLAVEVGNDSRLTIDSGSGAITNNGTVRIIAGAGPATGAVYTPILAGTRTGSGIYQAFGGKWNVVSNELTVSAVEHSTSGTWLTIDLAEIERVWIDDSTTGWSLGASFHAKTDAIPLDFKATAISDAELGLLEGQLEPEDSVLGGWLLAAAGGYTPGDPAYLSFEVGPGLSLEDLQVWHHEGFSWGKCAAWDFMYDGTYASFTAAGSRGYAVIRSIAVPEPKSIVLLLAITALALARCRKRPVSSCV